MRVIQLSRRDDDDKAFLFRLEHMFIGALRHARPQYAHFAKVDNWFGPKWRYFAGSRAGRDLLEQERLCVPPFAHKRIIEERSYERHQELLKRVPSLKLHSKSSPRDKRTRYLDQIQPSGLYCWYSGNTAAQDRGSIMVYDLSEAQMPRAWYAELRKREGVWTVSSVAGTSTVELAALETSHHDRLAPLSVHPDEIKRVENLELLRAAAKACYDDHRVAEAAVLISQYRANRPKRHVGALLEAVNQGRRRQFEQARSGLRAVEEVENKTPEKRGEWLTDWAELCEASGDLDGEIEARRELVTLRPEHTAPRVLLGGALARQGRLEEAMTIHRGATSLQGDPDEAFLNLALIQRAMGRFHEAKTACEEALALCPDYPGVKIILSDLVSALALDTSQEEFAGGRALWFACLDASYGGDRTAAQAQVLVEAYSRDNPEDPYGRLLLARSLAKARRFAEAESMFRECESALRSTRDRRAWLREWADAAELRPDFQAREMAYRELASEAEADGYDWMQLGRCLADQGKHEEAEAILEHACGLDSESPQLSHLHLGLMLRDLGRLEEAARAFQEGLGALPDHRPSQLALADVEAALRARQAQTDSREA